MIFKIYLKHDMAFRNFEDLTKRTDKILNKR